MDVRRAVRPRSLLVGLLLASLVAGCGGAGQSESSTGDEPQEQVAAASPTAAGDGADEAGAVEAVLEVIDTAVEVRPAAAEAFDEAADGLGLVAGDTVQTDPVGFAEIRYDAGSITRVDVDSTVIVVALEGSVDAPDVQVELDVGRVWNRVGAAEDGARRFEVATDVGTAAVRGTAFEVDCRATLAGACLFAVYEGTVEVTPLDDDPVVLGPFEYVLVAADGTVADQGTIAPDLGSPEAIDGDWVRRNAEMDEEDGAAPLDGLEDEPTSALAYGDIYDCGTAGTDATSYMRFFEDGEVIAVSSTGTPEQVSTWFVRPSEDPDFDNSVGTYTVVDGRIEGSTTSQFDETSDITVSFEGTVAPDSTLTMTTTSTNGFVDDVTCTPVFEA